MKQTRGAINFLIASYNGVLKNALIASMATVALSGAANAKTIDLSDDAYFTSSSVDITDDRDGSDTLITITDSNFNDTRTVGEIYNSNGNMSFDKGGKIKTQLVALADGKFEATDTSITTDIITIKDKYSRNNLAKFGDLTVTTQANSDKASIQVNKLLLDGGSSSKFDQVLAKDVQIGNTSIAGSSIAGTTAFVEYLKADNLLVTSKFGQASTIAAVNLNGNNVVTGNVAVGQNAALILGYHKEENKDPLTKAQIMIAGQTGIAAYDSPDAPLPSAMLFVNDNIETFDGAGITVDAMSTNPTVRPNEIILGERSAITLSDEVTKRALYTGDNKPAINCGSSCRLSYTNSSKIILKSNLIREGSVFRIFDGVLVKNVNGDSAPDLLVQSANGNFKTAMRNGDSTGYTITNNMSGNNSSTVTNPDNTNRPSDSDTGNAGTNAGNAGNTGNAGTTTGGNTTAGGNASTGGNTTNNGNSTSNGGNTLHQTFTRGNFYNQGSSIYETMQDAIHDLTSVGKAGADFLATVAGETFTGGKEAEQAARLGQLGGAYQAAFTVSSITDDIVSSRNGVGSSTGSLIVSDNNNGFGIWLSPMVKVASSDGFDSDGLSYGTRVRLTDFAIGADYTLNNGSRLGAYFHTGNGKSTGKGLASHTDGDLKYYGAGLYGKYSYNNFSLLADVSYNKITDDVDTDLGLQSYSRASSSVDTYMVKAGLTGQYNFNVNTVSVILHAGVRYTTLKSDDYSVQAKCLYIANVKSDRTKVVSFPVGVTVEKAFNVGQTDWKVKPAVDLGVNFNTGDTDASYKTTFIGANEASLNAEIADSVVYTAGAGLKFSHQKNADIEAGVVYAASENTNDVTFHVNGSYQF